LNDGGDDEVDGRAGKLHQQEMSIMKQPGAILALIIGLATALILPNVCAYDKNASENAQEWLNLSLDIAGDANARNGPDDLTRAELNLSLLSVEKSLDMDRNLSRSWEQKGDLLSQSGRYEEAAACYERLLNEDPMDQGVWLKKGQAFDGLNRWSEAIYCYNMVISCCQYWTSAGVSNNEARKQEGDAWYNKAWDFSQLKDHEKALLCFNRSVEIFSDPNASEDVNDLASSWSGKGNSLRALGRYEEAMLCYDEIILSMDRYSPNVVNALSAKGLAELLLARNLSSKDLQNAYLHYNLSATYFAKAIETLENDDNLTNDKDAWSDYFGEWVALHYLPGREKHASDAFDKSIALTGGMVMPSWGSLAGSLQGLFIRAKEGLGKCLPTRKYLM